MSKNIFKDWTPEQVEAHNAKVAGTTLPALPKKTFPRVTVDAAQRPSTDEAKLNKTETDYLAILRAKPTVRWIGIQAITFKLADNCRYTPDFCIITEDNRFIAIDTKGKHIWEDSKIKMKMAARIFTWVRFVIAQKKAGKWSEYEFKP